MSDNQVERNYKILYRMLHFIDKHNNWFSLTKFDLSELILYKVISCIIFVRDQFMIKPRLLLEFKLPTIYFIFIFSNENTP